MRLFRRYTVRIYIAERKGRLSDEAGLSFFTIEDFLKAPSTVSFQFIQESVQIFFLRSKTINFFRYSELYPVSILQIDSENILQWKQTLSHFYLPDTAERDAATAFWVL